MIQTLVLSVALPGLVAFVALLVGWRPWRRGDRAMRGAWSGAVAFGGAFLVSFASETRGFRFPPPERWQWIAPLVALAMAIGLAVAVLGRAKSKSGRSTWLRLTGALALGAGAAWMLDLPRLEGAVARTGVGLAVAATFYVLDQISARHPGVLAPLVTAVCLTAVSIIVVQSNNIFATIAGGCGAATGSATLVALFRRDFTLAAGATPVLATAIVVIGACGYAYDYAEIPMIAFALPALSLAACLACDAPVFRGLTGLKGGVLRIGVVTLVCAAAVAWVLVMSRAGSDASDYGY